MISDDAPPRRMPAARRIRFRYAGDDVRKYFAGGEIAASHLDVQMSALFPPGEAFFVRAVRRYRDEITDPVLREQVDGFLGQEAVHGREHREVNRYLDTLGYHTRLFEKEADLGLKVLERVSPRIVPLALTAALEHYTATMGEWLMSSEESRAQFDPAMCNLLLWHSLEESEHKTVAIDVFRAVGGTETVRRLAMHGATVAMFVVMLGNASVSMALDRQAWAHPVRTLRSVGRLGTSAFVGPELRRRVWAYHRKGFRPDEQESEALCALWRERLFGEGGALVDKLVGDGRPGDRDLTAI